MSREVRGLSLMVERHPIAAGSDRDEQRKLFQIAHDNTDTRTRSGGMSVAL